MALVPEEKQIEIEVFEEDIEISSGQAKSIALVVNELICNALEHAFTEKEIGTISLTLCRGNLFHTLTVADDGCGFKQPRGSSEECIGLRIVEAIVHDELQGQFYIRSNANGTRASFDIKVET